ncbi:MAG: hypothetical protein KAI47_22575 [Deltaproteobacteria bacterium]|nr:hypothetical protein [Deltaproteobacteria bacterium]
MRTIRSASLALGVIILLGLSPSASARPIQVSNTMWVFQGGWNTRARFFYGIGQFALHANQARSFIGGVQLGLYGSYAKEFAGLFQIGPLNDAKVFMGLAQIGGWNVHRRKFAGLGQLGLFNESSGNLIAAFQIGGYNRVHGTFYGALQIGVVNHTGKREVLGPVQVGLLNWATHDLTSALGQFGVGNVVDHTFQGPFQVGVYNTAEIFYGAAQIGGFNYIGDEILGAQIGIANLARSVSGVQIGLFNYARKLQGLQIGLVNISRHGGLPFMLIANAGF